MKSASLAELRPLVLLPTYNERENLDAILSAIRKAQPSFDVLVIDDASPDGSGAIADRRAAEDSSIHVLHRAGKEGLGKAYLDGFRWALAQSSGYTHLIQMDADFSHDPKYLGSLLNACCEGASVSVGSRYVRGGGTDGWPWHRRWLSRGGGLYARSILGVGLRDLTAGFVCMAREALEGLDLDAVATSGYGFQIEMKFRFLRAGCTVAEVPIVFVDRQYGRSKMNTTIVLEALALVWRLRFSSSRVSRSDG